MIFLKFGGSLITQKEQPQTPRVEVISHLAQDIAEALEADPGLHLLLGHGSGSFGHHVADKYQTQLGASSKEDWFGFTEVWAVANRLNRLVIDALLENKLPIISMPPSASTISDQGKIVKLAVDPIQKAIDVGLIPVVQGDVAFDLEHGSTIVSTEDVFVFLAPYLKPSLILLAGIEPGVFESYPDRVDVLTEITEENIDDIGIAPAASTDVTGGMAAKVHQALSICQMVPGLEVRIFSGEDKGTVRDALAGAPVGTLIKTASHG